jgi:hypothetical protein
VERHIETESERNESDTLSKQNLKAAGVYSYMTRNSANKSFSEGTKKDTTY